MSANTLSKQLDRSWPVNGYCVQLELTELEWEEFYYTAKKLIAEQRALLDKIRGWK